MKRAAEFAKDPDGGLHRLWLTRVWAEGPRLAVVGLNPSKADDKEDDRTIERCVFYATREGYGSLAMVNLFTLVSTDPRALLTARFREWEPARSQRFAQVFRSNAILVGWGGLRPAFRAAAEEYREELALHHRNLPMFCLGRTKWGRDPVHPSRKSNDRPFEPWTP